MAFFRFKIQNGAIKFWMEKILKKNKATKFFAPDLNFQEFRKVKKIFEQFESKFEHLGFVVSEPVVKHGYDELNFEGIRDKICLLAGGNDTGMILG